MASNKLKELIMQLQSKGYKKPIHFNDGESRPISNIATDALKNISGGEIRIYAEFSKSL